MSAASVWMTFSTSRLACPSRAASERPRALTTPAVTEPAKPSGLPIATTSWPTRSRAASPNGAGGEVRPGRPDDGEVGQRIAPDDLEAELVAVDERGGSPFRAGDDVGVGDEEAVRRERDGRAAAAAPAAVPALDPEAGDRRDQPRGRRADGRRVGVERLLLDRLGEDVVARPRSRRGSSSRRATIDQASPGASVVPPTLTVRSSSPRTIFSSIGMPGLGEDRRQAVGVGQRPAGRLDEQVALADPGPVGRAAVLDAADQQAVTLGAGRPSGAAGGRRSTARPRCRAAAG